MKMVMVACGSGVATSETVAAKVKDLLAERGIKVTTEVSNFFMLHAAIKTKHPDLFISIIGATDKTDYGVPSVSGIPFLTGVGLDAAMERVVEILSRKK